MQDGKELGPDDVQIEGEETRENLARPVDPESQLDEVARSAGDKVKSDENSGSDEDDEAAPDDP